MITFQFKAFIEKIKVLRYLTFDKYDNYEFLNNIHQDYQLKPIYFVLFSKYSKFDKNLSRKNPAFRKLVKSISDNYELGIHPSYRSNSSFKILNNEKETLEKTVGKSISKSRQHYLKLQLPLTYENLIKLNIEQDYSMGYPSNPGFRASTCSIHYFFNLKTNQKTNLQIIPFAIMDACFIYYLKLDPEKALKKIKKIMCSVKKVNGLFVSLWHNESLYKEKDQNGWQYVFTQMLLNIKNGNSI